VVGQKRTFWLSGVAVIGLSPFLIVATGAKAIAATLVPCGDVLPSVGANPEQFPTVGIRNNVISSFLNGQCAGRTIQELRNAGESLTFYRYFTAEVPGVPSINKGSYLTTDKYDINLDAVTFLALDKEFGNNADSRQFVDISALPLDTVIYQGVAGPQPAPPAAPNACYPGGGQQTYVLFKDSRDPKVKYTFDQFTTKVASDCIYSVPEPSPLFGIGALATIGLAATFSRTFVQSKTKQQVRL